MPIIVVIEPRSNSRSWAHREGLAEPVALANQAIWYAPANLGWDLAATVAGSPVPTTVCDSEAIIAKVKADAGHPGGGHEQWRFCGLHGNH